MVKRVLESILKYFGSLVIAKVRVATGRNMNKRSSREERHPQQRDKKDKRKRKYGQRTDRRLILEGTKEERSRRILYDENVRN